MKEILYRKVETDCNICLSHPHVGKDCFVCHGTKKVITYEPIQPKPKKKKPKVLKAKCTSTLCDGFTYNKTYKVIKEYTNALTLINDYEQTHTVTKDGWLQNFTLIK